jgi:hypothetical protein
MDADDPNGDERTRAPDMTPNDDGTWKVQSEQVRYPVYTPGGYDADQIETDQAVLIERGYMQASDDWTNVEITGYLRVNDYTDNSTNGGPHIEFFARGGRHSSSASCEGTALHSNVYVEGRVKFEKELEHTAGYTDNDPDIDGAIDPLQDRWVGIKGVFYNLPDGNVRLETWVDDTSDNESGPGNDWRLIHEYVDDGNWGGGEPNCGGSDDTIITWGAPMATFRWDNIEDMDLKYLSVREIAVP